MRGKAIPDARELRAADRRSSDDPHDAGGFRASLSGIGRGHLRPGVAWMDGLLHATGSADATAGPLSGGGQRPSGTGRANGGDLGTSRGAMPDGGFAFDAAVAPGGYRWWYVDALSDDGEFGIVIIAFIGSVFSPYYAWSGWRDPYRHCAVNVALYGRGARWAMTERGRDSLAYSQDRLDIGPSSLEWRDGALVIRIDECAAPIPRAIRGEVVIEPRAILQREFTLETEGRHVWRPIAPVARARVDLEAPDLRWRGHAYLDTNAGDEPLEKAFSFWTWSRARLPDGAAIFYEAERRREGPLSLALRFNGAAEAEMLTPPPLAPLTGTRWFVPRRTRAEAGEAHVRRTLEDTPFYARSVVSARFAGASHDWVHESLSLDRFANPLVRLMLPFRMPRRA